MIKYVMGMALLVLSTTVFAVNNPGDVTFVNNGNVVSSTDAVQYKIVTQDGRDAYTLNLSAKQGANRSTLTRGAIGKQTTSFNVYIRDVAQVGQYKLCMQNVTYGPDWKPQYIFGWFKGNDFKCALGSA